MKYSIAVLLFFIGCSGAATRPDWVDGTSQKFDARQYLLGRGQADTREAAQDRARADLAKIFAVAVDAYSVDTTAYRSDGPKNRGQTTQAITRTISAGTEQLLRGSEIADLWRDPADGSYHALAALRRADAVAQLRRDFGQCDGRVRVYVERVQSADALARAGDLYRALGVQRDCAGYRASLDAIDSAVQTPSTIDTRSLKQQLGAALAAVHIAVATDDKTGIAARLQAALTQAGFGKGDDYRLQAALTLADLGPREGWFWYSGNLELRLTDRAGQVRGNARWPLKVAASEASLAYPRALEQIDALLKQQLRATICEWVPE